MDIETSSHLKKGRLPCGLRYYVLGNAEKPRGSVELRLVVKVGSLMEEDNERGLAHFIEHLGFKGTENFAKYELVRFLQSLGISYGADLNASTHLLETTFQLSTDVNNGLENFKHAVAILKEWAFHMRIDEHDVTEEKSVIYAEYVSKQGLSERLLKKYWAAVFEDPVNPGCKLAKRMPIGIPDVFMNTNAKQIREFYEKWYTPDNMCMVVVGDFACDEGRVQEAIDVLVDIFKSVPASPISDTSEGKGSAKHHLQLPQHHVRDTYVALTDKELSVAQISFEFFAPCPAAATQDYLRQDIIRRLICSVYDRRLHAIAEGHCPFYDSTCPPFISAGISIRQIVRGLLCFGLSATLDSDGTENAEVELKNARRVISALLTEMKRFAMHGVTVDEFSAAKSKWGMLFCDQRDHTFPEAKAITSDLVNHILCEEKSIFQDSYTEATMCIDCVDSISIEELNEAILGLDMHIADNLSQNYLNSNSISNPSGKFRVICAQFPSHRNSLDADIDECTLEAMMLEERNLVAANSANILPWMHTVKIEPSTVTEAALIAIEKRYRAANGCLGTGECAPLDAVCLCCPKPSSFLPKSFICSTISPLIPLDAGVDPSHLATEENKKLTAPTQTTVSHFDSVQVTEVVLCNGIKVALKWMPESCPNKISMQAFTLGGSTELSEAEEIVMSRLDSIAEQSFFEIGDDMTCLASQGCLECAEYVLRGTDVVELQSRTKTYVSTQRHYNHRGIGGSCPSSNFELLLAFVALKLTSQKILTSAVEKNINLVRSQLATMNNAPEAQFMERARLLSCGDIPISRPISAAAIDGITVDMASELFSRGFLRDPTEFTFVFVGALPPLAETTALLEKYLSRLQPLPSSANISPWVLPMSESPTSVFPFTPFPAVFPSESIREELHLRQAEKSSVLIVYRKNIPVMEGAIENVNVFLDALCKVVEIKLLDYLRIQLGKVYNVVVDHSRNSLSTFALLTVGFHCEPGDCGLIEEAVEAVIQLMQEVGPDAGSLEGVKEAMTKKHSRDLESSSHWLFWILDSYKDHAYDSWFSESKGENSVYSVSSLIEARSYKKSVDIQEKLTCQHIQGLLNDTLKGVRATVVLSPEVSASPPTSRSDEDQLAVAASSSSGGGGIFVC